MNDSTSKSSGEMDKRESVSRAAVIDAIDRALDRLRYGAIHLSIHDGKVVQIEITERRRFS